MKLGQQVWLTLSLLLVYLLFKEHLSSYQNVICVFAILLFGIPHGAIDHILHRKFSKSKNHPTDRKFITWYVLCMLAYFVVWIFFPFRAFLLFIAMALYHFGQEFVEEIGIPSESKFPILIFGCNILIMPLLIHYEEVASFLLAVINVELPQISSQVVQYIALSIPVLSVFYFVQKYLRRRLSKETFLKVIIYLLMWLIIYILTPFLVGFTLYFVLHHSINSMKHQYHSIAKLSHQYGLKSYLKDVGPLTLVAYFGITFILIVSGVQTLEYFTLYALIFISVLTLPHMLVFDDFYKERIQ